MGVDTFVAISSLVLLLSLILELIFDRSWMKVPLKVHLVLQVLGLGLFMNGVLLLLSISNLILHMGVLGSTIPLPPTSFSLLFFILTLALEITLAFRFSSLLRKIRKNVS